MGSRFFAHTLISVLFAWPIVVWGYFINHVGLKVAVSNCSMTMKLPLTIFSVNLSDALICLGLTLLVGVGLNILSLLTVFFRDAQKPMLGGSRFGNMIDAIKAKLFAKQGLWLGHAFGRPIRLGGDESALVVAPTGSGKTTSLAVPNILTFNGSIIVNDSKGEIYDLCARTMQKRGTRCYLFAPLDLNSCGYNPFSFIRLDPEHKLKDLILLAEALIPNGNTDNSSFWQDNSQKLFICLSLYVLELEEGATLGKLFDVAHQEDLRKWFKLTVKSRIVEDPLFAQLSTDIISGFKETIANIITSFRTSIKSLAIPSVQRSTSKNNLYLDKLRDEKFLICCKFPPNNCDHIKPLITALWAQLIDIQTRSNRPKGHSLLFLMDEFGNLGQLNALAQGMTYLRSYRIRLMVIVQHLGQITERYGQHAARSFKSAKAKVIYALTDLEDARYISEMMGKQTVKVTNRNRHSGGATSNESLNDQWTERPLMQADEILRLRQNEGLLLLEGRYPFKIKKKPWFKNQKFKKMLRGKK